MALLPQHTDTVTEGLLASEVIRNITRRFQKCLIKRMSGRRKRASCGELLLRKLTDLKEITLQS